MRKSTVYLFTSIICFIFISSGAIAKPILIGQSCALTGPAQALGLEMKRGAEAFFDKYPGKISMISVDDRYEPDRAVANTKKFINEKNVDLLFGYVGTPTSKVALPVANDAGKIYFGAFTGAGFLRDYKTYPYSFNVRGSYDDETRNMIRHLVKDLGVKKVAIFYQNDSFGKAGLSGVNKALKKKKIKATGISLVAEGTYERNTVAVEAGAKKIKAANPEAIILIGAYKPCGAAIKWWKQNDVNVPFINISFVGSEALAKELAGDTKNVVISQAVPFPWDTSLSIVKDYQKDIKRDFTFASFEGYLAARILYEGLKGINFNYSPSALKDYLEKNMRYVSIGGVKVAYTSKDHQALLDVYLTKINNDGTFTLMKSLKEL